MKESFCSHFHLTQPPVTTHLCQLLDKGPLAPLKLEWRKAVQQFIAANQGRVVSRYDFSALFAEAWFKAMTMKNITAGFRSQVSIPSTSNLLSY